MKTFVIIRLSLGLLFGSLASLAHAQAAPPASPQPAYWNVETNLTTRDYTIVRFYNGQDQLVYEERLDGLNLDLRKGNRCCRRTSQQLNVALATVLRNPAAARLDASLLAQAFGQDRRVQRAYAVR